MLIVGFGDRREIQYVPKESEKRALEWSGEAGFHQVNTKLVNFCSLIGLCYIQIIFSKTECTLTKKSNSCVCFFKRVMMLHND